MPTWTVGGNEIGWAPVTDISLFRVIILDSENHKVVDTVQAQSSITVDLPAGDYRLIVYPIDPDGIESPVAIVASDLSVRG